MADASHTKPIRVLVIDDDPLFRSLLASLLRKDCDVVVASEGSDGFYKALEQPPDVALIDVQMPGWDGLKTLKAFRGHPLLANVRAIMLTSDASKETVLAAIHAGANDYLIKTTFSKRDFFQKLNCQLPERTAVPAEPASAPADAKSIATGASHPNGSAQAATSNPLDDLNNVALAAISAPESDESRLQELMDNWD